MIGVILLGLFYMSFIDENHEDAESVVSDQPEFEPATSQCQSHALQMSKSLCWQCGKRVL